MVDFASNTIWLNSLIFTVAAGVIWVAGTKLEHFAEAIAEATGIGKAFIGLLLLAVATSLPELATSTTAALIGNAQMAIHNLLGGVVLQTAVLAIADAAEGRGPLTYFAPRFVLLMQGIGVILLLSIVLMTLAVAGSAVIPGAPGATGVIVGLAALPGIYLLILYITYRNEGRPRWRATDEQAADNPEPTAPVGSRDRSLRGWIVLFCGASLLVTAGGWAVAQTGDALAVQTGLGASFIGATLVALATSLPEITTTAAAARRGHPSMAVSNIFGSNAVDITLLGIVGLIAGTSAFTEPLPTALFAAALGIVLTCVYLCGLLIRRNYSLLRLGWDSWVAVILTILGLAVIYQLK